MSNERPSRPEQRFSRYSRASYDEFTAAPSENDLSLVELTERALKRERTPEPAVAAARPLSSFDQRPPRGIDQPPPPSGMDSWNDRDAHAQQGIARAQYPLDSLTARLNSSQ